jgi:hypothetical protein
MGMFFGDKQPKRTEAPRTDYKAVITEQQRRRDALRFEVKPTDESERAVLARAETMQVGD